MLRYLFRQARTVRVPLKNGEFDIQRVTVKRKSKVDISRLLTTFLISYCVVRTVSYVLSRGDKQSDSRIDAERWKKELEGQQDAVATGSTIAEQEGIPFMLPIWLRRRRSPLYTADDPDWKAFQKAQQDKKLMSEMRVAIIQLLEKEINKDKWRPSIQAINAGGKIQTRSSLILVPPLFPPDIYEVPCVFVVPGGLKVGWRRLPQHMGSRLDHIFHPVVFTDAFYVAFQVFCKTSYQITHARLTDRFNSSKSSSADGVPPAEIGELSQTEEKKVSETEKTLSRLVSQRQSEDDKAIWLPFLHGEYGERPAMRNYRDLVKSMTYRGAIDEACGMFRAKWIIGLSNMQAKTAIRDGCTIEGTVDLVGVRGVVRLFVLVAYSPESNAITSPLVIVRANIVPHAARWHDEKYGAPVVSTSSREKTVEQSPWKDSKVGPRAPESRADTEGKEKK
ncbi:hypothetical protein EDD37DRAFT_484051 [Exophiala viscosa]|uniref:Uncharacterized protein n=1 Tax=Exophiala viscosa TaxID=2486360 RepID=A0AAN6DYT3_9EURO|nr:hypothetical protein EDD36DRAFT_206855 [Exophiala viscosa]KAI1622673.1 hypothetical protein EDD37DRAFT_484051 [Exophiala viscosa]